MKKSNSDNSNTIIIIRSPAECVQKISINSDGNFGYIVGGVSSYRYLNEFKKFDYVKDSLNSKLNAKDMAYINKKLNSFKDSKIDKKIRKDAFRFELYIDGNKKIDVFGNSPENLLEILEKLKPYIPKADYACW